MRIPAHLLVCSLALAVIALFGAKLRADVYTNAAYDNGTVWPVGPRNVPNGKNYFDVEGMANGNFAAFAVADFASTHFRNASHQPIGQISKINSISVVLTQDNAAFTTNGKINFYITRQLVTSIDPDASSAETTFDVNDANGEGLNGQFTPLAPVGTGSFAQGQSGQVDTFPLTLDADTASYLVSQINNLGTIRVIITPADPNVSATYAGFTDTNPNNTYAYTGPVITIDAN
jgi:hypothetical protein